MGEIQRLLENHQNIYGREMPFVNAVKKLCADGKAMHTMPPDADVNAWNTRDAYELKKIYDNHPIDVTDVLEHPDIYTSVLPEAISFFSRDIWPAIHFCHVAVNMHTVNGFEIIYVMEGECRLYINDEQNFRTLEKGSFAIIAPNTMHDSYTVGDSVVLGVLVKKNVLDTAFLSILKTDSVLAAFFKNSMFSAMQNYLLFMVTPTEKINGLIKNILIESGSCRPFANEICDSLMSILLAEVLRSHIKTYLYSSNKRSTNSQMPLILTYIKTNFRTIKLKALAQFFGYDADYLGKLIFQSTGMHFNDIVNTYKTDLAAELLLYSDYAIDEIAEMVGFASTDHFNRTFKKMKRTTPGKYRKNS